jgi:ABC-type sugar transport system permease subunit
MRARHPAHPYLMLLPNMVLLLLFFFYPLAFAARKSLYDWDLLTPPRWVGFENYRALFETGQFATAFRTTLTLSVIVVTGSMSVGLALALMLSGARRLQSFVRAAVFSAYVVSWVSVALLWLWLLDPAAGLFARVFQSLGLQSFDLLGDPRFALYMLSAITVWKITGYALILFIAGLQDIAPALYEAAALDGASRWQRFSNVTWPMLRPTTAFVAITSLIASFKSSTWSE